MSRYDAQTYAILRIVMGFLFLCHGSQKLLGFPIGLPEGMPAPIQYIAGSIELVGGALILIGLMTRPAAFLCSGLMAAAYWLAHGTNAVLPLVNHGELAVMFCFAFLFIAAHGSGIWSVDATRSGD
ncbi:MAG: DoxX family protein [Myxococcota bacterium]